jgi:GNAT superfamily N-acetyltransferase
VTFTLISAAERPDLVEAAEAMAEKAWPVYLGTANYFANWDKLYSETLAPFQTIAIDDAGEIAALANSTPFVRPEGDLPDEGWDWVLASGVKAAAEGNDCNALSALSIVVKPEHRASGLAAEMLKAMRGPARKAGLQSMVAPVRPTRKSRYPLQDFETYCHWTREDGTPFDPWLRTHVELGARLLRPAMKSMTVTAALDRWTRWTGLRFPVSGEYWIEGGLAPLIVNLQAESGTYLEPNYWLEHQLG